MAIHRWNSKLTHTAVRRIKVVATTALIATSTTTWAQVDITKEVTTNCTNSPFQPEILLSYECDTHSGEGLE
jgi:hypothetical protein